MRRSDTQRGVSLGRLLANSRFVGCDDLRVTSCTHRAQDCLPGDLFVAIDGVRADGHDYVHDALRRGAQAVLCERDLPTHGAPYCVVDDTREAYGRLCQRLVGDPSHDLQVVGVTGTNGKTTTSCLIASVLEAAGLNVGVLGTLGYTDSVDVEPAEWTTPPPHVSARWLARMRANGCTHAVMEFSSHALAQRRTSGIRLDAACVTNVRRDHLDYHGSSANYHNAKRRIIDHLAPGGVAVFNADDPVCARFLSTAATPALAVGLGGVGDLTATVVERFRSEQTFLLNAGSDTAPVCTRIIGDHHVYNCLMAAAVGLAWGIDLGTVVRGLENLDEVPGRMQRIECGQPYGVFVDYAHTADALATVLGSLRGVTEGKVICVFGAGGDRDRQKRPAMGRAVERLADVAVLTNDNPRREDPTQIANDVLRGFARADDVIVQMDRAEAIAEALSMAVEGDSVVIAGKGHEQCQVVGTKRYFFDDRAVARSWLREHVRVEPILGASSS